MNEKPRLRLPFKVFDWLEIYTPPPGLNDQTKFRDSPTTEQNVDLKKIEFTGRQFINFSDESPIVAPPASSKLTTAKFPHLGTSSSHFWCELSESKDFHDHSSVSPNCYRLEKQSGLKKRGGAAVFKFEPPANRLPSVVIFRLMCFGEYTAIKVTLNKHTVINYYNLKKDVIADYSLRLDPNHMQEGENTLKLEAAEEIDHDVCVYGVSLEYGTSILSASYHWFNAGTGQGKPNDFVNVEFQYGLIMGPTSKDEEEDQDKLCRFMEALGTFCYYPSRSGYFVPQLVLALEQGLSNAGLQVDQSTTSIWNAVQIHLNPKGHDLPKTVSYQSWQFGLRLELAGQSVLYGPREFASYPNCAPVLSYTVPGVEPNPLIGNSDLQ